MIASANDVRALAEFYSPYGWLVAVWTASLAGVCVCVTAGLPLDRRDSPDVRRTWQRPPTTKAEVVAIGVLAIFAYIYGYLILSGEDLVGIDYAQITASRFVAMAVWPSAGRFFPLGLQEYNVLALISKSATVYHLFSIVQLSVVIVCVFRILDERPAWLRCIVIVVMMTMPSFVEAFLGLVIPERDILFWLGIWIVLLQTFARTGSRTALCGVLIAAQFILYYKETAFVFIGGFAGSRLLLSVWKSGNGPRGRRYANLLKAHALEVGHLALCVIFLSIYLGYIRPRVTASYVNAGGIGASVAALNECIRSDFLFDALGLAFGARLVAIVAGKRQPDTLWEPLAASALAYGVAYIKLGMMRDYYLAPADFIAVLYVGRLAHEALRVQRRVIVACIALAVALIARYNIGDAAFEILSRKGFVAANVSLASFLRDYARANARTNLSLYFPEVGGFEAMEFSAFLQYKGLRPAAMESPSSQNNIAFAVATPHRYPGDRCHPSQAFLCVYKRIPQVGDLIVFLPGRPPSISRLEESRTHSTVLFRFRSGASSVERLLHALVPSDLNVEPVDAYVFRY